MNNGSQFFNMPGSDKIALILILAYSIITFFFVNSPVKISGVSIFGWLMGALMFLAPLISLVSMKFETQIKSERRSSGESC